VTARDDEALARLRTAGDLAGLADALGALGARALDDGDWPTAIRALDEAAAVCEAMQRPALAAQASIGVVLALRGMGRHTEALARAHAAVTLAPGGPSKIAALTTLGTSLRAIGDHAAAHTAFTAALDLAQPAGLQPLHAAALQRMIDVSAAAARR
jgi:tetratricopeptide (TPR) repeat protein